LINAQRYSASVNKSIARDLHPLAY